MPLQGLLVLGVAHDSLHLDEGSRSETRLHSSRDELESFAPCCLLLPLRECAANCRRSELVEQTREHLESLLALHAAASLQLGLLDLARRHLKCVRHLSVSLKLLVLLKQDEASFAVPLVAPGHDPAEQSLGLPATLHELLTRVEELDLVPLGPSADHTPQDALKLASSLLPPMGRDGSRSRAPSAQVETYLAIDGPQAPAESQVALIEHDVLRLEVASVCHALAQSLEAHDRCFFPLAH